MFHAPKTGSPAAFPKSRGWFRKSHRGIAWGGRGMEFGVTTWDGPRGMVVHRLYSTNCHDRERLSWRAQIFLRSDNLRQSAACDPRVSRRCANYYPPVGAYYVVPCGGLPGFTEAKRLQDATRRAGVSVGWGACLRNRGAKIIGVWLPTLPQTCVRSSSYAIRPSCSPAALPSSLPA